MDRIAVPLPLADDGSRHRGDLLIADGDADCGMTGHHGQCCETAIIKMNDSHIIGDRADAAGLVPKAFYTSAMFFQARGDSLPVCTVLHIRVDQRISRIHR